VNVRTGVCRLCPKTHLCKCRLDLAVYMVPNILCPVGTVKVKSSDSCTEPHVHLQSIVNSHWRVDDFQLLFKLHDHVSIGFTAAFHRNRRALLQHSTHCTARYRLNEKLWNFFIFNECCIRFPLLGSQSKPYCRSA
jgi:hypothetical protein